MTNLQRLIDAQVQATTVTTISRATEKVTEELTREILKDAEFKNKMIALVKNAVERTLTELAAEVTPQ